MTEPDDRPYERASLWLAISMILAVAGSVEARDLRPFAVIAVVSLVALGQRLRRLEPISSYWPTAITIGRMLVTAFLAYNGADLSPLALVFGALAVFSADGLDGYLARRLGAESKLGARLDGETDAFFVMMLSLLLWQRGQAGTWVLTAGLLRYGYVLAVAALSARGEAPRSRFARYVFGLAVSGLTLGFITTGENAAIGPAVATGLLVVSFGRSFAYSLAVTKNR